MIGKPFSSKVPKEMVANLKWRANVQKRVLRDKKYTDVIWDACSKDPIFFVSGFGYTYDPRRKPFPKLPFILYPFQEEAILELVNAIDDGHDILVEKSRDMGASWLCVLAIEWHWLFRPMQSFLFVSRVEEYVDAPGNPKSMFWKFDYLLDNLPQWLRPPGYSNSEHRRKLHIENPDNLSVVDGESTTGNVARGDRRTAILLDEFAAVMDGHRVLSSTRDATQCRIFNSTPAGTNNAFYDMRQSGIKKLRLHWSHHPLKSYGLYTTGGDGGIKVIDPNGFPGGYAAILDGKMRSPWYDRECERAGSEQEIAQELDIDYLGSGFQYFSGVAIQEAIRKYARPPMLIGDLEHDDRTAEPLRFSENEKGNMRLWCLLDREGKPPKDHRYVAAVDVSAGTGASNSCIVVYDTVTCEKIVEYANAYIRPEALAKQAVALCKWFGNAFLIWESNGPGRQFGSRVMDLSYGNVYLRRRDEAISGKVSDIPGWASTKETKLVLMGDYRSAVEKGDIINRSKEAMEETLEYIFLPDGGIEHSRATNKTDPSGARANHGDRVIADALAWRGMSENAKRPTQQKPEVPIGSLQWRINKRKQDKQPKNKELGRGWK